MFRYRNGNVKQITNITRQYCTHKTHLNLNKGALEITHKTP